MPNDEFTDLQPCPPQTDEQKIDVLLDLLANGFEDDADLDVVRDAALHHLLLFPQLPERTIDIMLSILGDKDESDLVLNRKMAALDVLAHMGDQANPALAILIDLLPFVESERDVERWMALRSARAVWRITGDSECALEIAEKLAEDEEAWLRIHAADLLGEMELQHQNDCHD